MSTNSKPPVMSDEFKAAIKKFNEKYSCTWELHEKREFVDDEMFSESANAKMHTEFEELNARIDYRISNRPSFDDACPTFTEDEPYISVTYTKYNDGTAPEIFLYIYYGEYVTSDCTYGRVTKYYTFDGTDTDWLGLPEVPADKDKE